jgi:hypothetical protein
MRIYISRSVLRSSCAAGIAFLTACTAGTGSDGVSTNTGIAGSWSTGTGVQNSMVVQLALAGTALSGSGTISVPPLTASTGPTTPTYTGDTFTITSGSYNAPTAQFTASLGANPDGAGGFYHGTLSFSGTLTSGTLTGTLTYTPPRTSSQTFAAQTVSGVTLTSK